MLEISFQFTFTPGIHDLALALPTPAGIALILFSIWSVGRFCCLRKCRFPGSHIPPIPSLVTIFGGERVRLLKKKTLNLQCVGKSVCCGWLQGLWHAAGVTAAPSFAPTHLGFGSCLALIGPQWPAALGHPSLPAAFGWLGLPTGWFCSTSSLCWEVPTLGGAWELKA